MHQSTNLSATEPPNADPRGQDSASEATASIGLSGRIARTFINTPVTPMLLIGALCIGLLGLLFTPRQEDPKISVPMIDIFVQYPGASAVQVESMVTQPLEQLMMELTGVRHVYSATQRGGAVVTVRFKVGEDMGQSVVKVHDKLQANMDRMPPDVQPPLVKPVSIDDVPIVTLTLWSDEVGDSQLRTLGLDVLQALGSVPNTGKGFVVGGREEQIRVEVMMERLAGYGITLDRIAQTIRSANAETQTGATEGGGTSYKVYSGAFLQDADDLERLVVGSQGGQPIYIRDIARVRPLPQETEQVVTHLTGPAYQGKHPANGAQAVTLAIAKKEGANGVTVAEAVLEKLAGLEQRMIPTNVQVEVTRNYGQSANDKVNELLKAMFEAALIVSILCLIGLGLRAAIVVISVIPVVILLTIWWAWMVDYSIDRVSLFALIFAIGILVDDATVVVENIFRHWLEQGKTSIAEAVAAVDEVGNPTILATFTIIAALLPMGWVSGLMGPYMRPIPVLGSSAMFFSLIAAFVFTPWFALRVRPRLKALASAERREQRTREIVSRFYRPLVMPLIENRMLGKAFLIGTILTTALVCTLFYFKVVPVKMLPFDNKPEFSVVVNMPEGTALPETANVVRRLAEKLKELPEVVAIQTYAGTAQPFNFNGMVRHYYLREQAWEGDLLVLLEDKHERKRGSHEIAVAARALLTPLAERLGARIAVVEMPPGPPVLQTVVAEIYGPTSAVRRQVAQDMTAMFEQAEGVVDVDNYLIRPYDAWRFEVDTEKAVRRGISVDTINRNLAMALGTTKVGDVKRGTVQEPTYIVIQVPLSYRSEITSLGSLPIGGPDGGMVPLAELGRFVRQPEDQTIYHKDLRPMEYVVGEMEGRLGAPIYGMFAVEDLLEGYDPPGPGESMSGMPDGLIGPPTTDAVADFEWSGEWTVTYETFRDMGIAFMAALLLIYGLIVWEFRDFAIAGLIMSPIPLTLIGIIPGHLLMGAEFTATSMIGMIALGGIIVRQSILIVEFVKIEVARGKPVHEAAVDGAEIRMRPILITSLTLMAGAWAIIDDPIFQGMAVSLLFGAGVATLMAVIVIPLGCISLTRRFYLVETESGERMLSAGYAELEGGNGGAGHGVGSGSGGEGGIEAQDLGEAGSVAEMVSTTAKEARQAQTSGGDLPLWMIVWSVLVAVISALINGVFVLIRLLQCAVDWLQRMLARAAARAGADPEIKSWDGYKPEPEMSARAERMRDRASPQRPNGDRQDQPEVEPNKRSVSPERAPSEKHEQPEQLEQSAQLAQPQATQIADTARAGTAKTQAKKQVAKKTAAKKTVAKKTAAKQPAVRKTTAKPTNQATAHQATAKEAVTKKAATKKAGTKKPVAKKAVAKKPVAKKAVAKKPVAKKGAARKTTPKPASSEAPSRSTKGADQNQPAKDKNDGSG
ncbi:efflux RND transporter permease subunit [Halochromatium roseum]|uniref:efflux RND transporter permease subunit n=1 Tax=Halochromatium roseum TaxID=391920 RepID=UPI001911972A|nr:efflux RND transporter permease subunit [Halochromatium roseum]MBK5940479.1 acriflavin resistance protein [Halochromatium roseum]